MTNAVYVISGLIALVYSADVLVVGAIGVATIFGLSPLLIGLTIVALGTSMPELIVSLQASLQGNSGIAVGNVVGSNIANIALILGITAMVTPIKCNPAAISRDLPITIAVSLILWIFCLNKELSRIESIFFLIILVGYIIYSYRSSLEEKKSEGSNTIESDSIKETSPNGKPPSFADSSFKIIIGLVGLMIGAKLLIDGAVNFAKFLNISDEIIGLTLVAVGTSLPEFFTSFIAAWKGNADIAIGNIVGSNLLNILVILGICGTIIPLGISDHMIKVDIPVMFGITLLSLPFMRTGFVLSKLEGFIFLVIYSVYTYMLF
ncbi:MAG: calcium/sodium antiporter [Candidatus Riflebacteria bacterium]|nr:calcium/sodium antiporter [Candidatus Riflebacteria bacterium]